MRSEKCYINNNTIYCADERTHIIHVFTHWQTHRIHTLLLWLLSWVQSPSLSLHHLQFNVTITACQFKLLPFSMWSKVQWNSKIIHSNHAGMCCVCSVYLIHTGPPYPNLRAIWGHTDNTFVYFSHKNDGVKCLPIIKERPQSDTEISSRFFRILIHFECRSSIFFFINKCCRCYSIHLVWKTSHSMHFYGLFP